MRFGSLFAGIGGLDLGLERAGMECAWQVEIDPYCVKVLEKHWPEVKRYGDVKTLYGASANATSKRREWAGETRNGWDGLADGNLLAHVDLICGGFPCQPFSVAGKRRGAADERNLWPEMLRVVREVGPRWVLGENVPGLGDYLDTVCADLEGAGYEVLPLEIPATAFGAPHLRYRVFIVAHAGHGFGGSSRNGQDIRWPSPSPSSRKRCRAPVAHRDGQRFGDARERQGALPVSSCGSPQGNNWAVEPDVGRVAHGVPARVDRLRCLGNAVVPQVAEWIGRRILEIG